MQINNTYTSFMADLPYPSKVGSNQQNSQVQEKQTSSVELQSLEQIQTMLQKEGIEDGTGRRAKDLFSLQDFANKIDDTTYNKMVDALKNEENSSLASMRFHSFPTQEDLEKDPKMFYARVETSLSMENTPSALIFNLNLKQGLSEYNRLNHSNESQELQTDIDFMSFIEYLKKKLFDASEKLEKGEMSMSEAEIKGYTTLLENYNNMEEKSSSLDIVV